MTDAPDELESAMILGDPGETVSLDTIKAMARAVRDAGFTMPAHQHVWIAGVRKKESDGVLCHEWWDEVCGCGSTQVRHWTTPVDRGEA